MRNNLVLNKMNGHHSPRVRVLPPTQTAALPAALALLVMASCQPSAEPVAHRIGQTTQKEIVARRITLVDDSGCTRAVLGVRDSMTAFSLHDQDGNIKMYVGVMRNGTTMEITADDHAGTGILIGDVKEALPSLIIRGESGKQVWMSCGENGPGLSLVDEKGRDRADLLLDAHGPRLALRDTTSAIRAVLGMAGEEPQLTTYDASGRVSGVWP